MRILDMTAADQNQARERAEAFRSFVTHPAVVGTLVGVYIATLVLALYRVFT